MLMIPPSATIGVEFAVDDLVVEPSTFPPFCGDRKPQSKSTAPLVLHSASGVRGFAAGGVGENEGIISNGT